MKRTLLEPPLQLRHTTRNCSSDQRRTLSGGRMAKTVKHTVKRRTGKYSVKTFYFFYDLTKWWWPERTVWAEFPSTAWEKSYLKIHAKTHCTRQHIWYPGVKAWQPSHSTTYPLPRSSQYLSTYPHKASQKRSCLRGLMNAFTQAQVNPLQPWPSVKVPINRQVSAMLVFSTLHCQADLEKCKTQLICLHLRGTP